MIQETAPEPGKKQALALSIGVHLLLVLALFLGVQWKTENAVVEVELWSAVPRPATSLPPPPASVRPPEPTPPKPEVAPEPKPVPKADIVVKDEKKPDEKPKQETPTPVKPDVKPDPIKEMQKQAADEEKRRRQEAQATERANREAAMREMANAEQQAAGRKSAENAWTGQITRRVRSNIVLPPNIQGNPPTLVKVTLLPTGEIINVQIYRSSGNSTLDDAVERGFLKSSPLPKPDDPTVFDRNLEITFRPYE